jgi:DNA-binding transcriptional ArsR family regulator
MEPIHHPSKCLITTNELNFDISGNLVDRASSSAYYVPMTLGYDEAATFLSQLGNKTRLKIVRELVRAGKTGMAVGEIQKILGTPNSTLSHHINHLRGVGLIRQTRESTVLRCFIEYSKIEEIVRFLTEECCAAEVHPD